VAAGNFGRRPNFFETTKKNLKKFETTEKN